jgi:hypothetical protein
MTLLRRAHPLTLLLAALLLALAGAFALPAQPAQPKPATPALEFWFFPTDALEPSGYVSTPRHATVWFVAEIPTLTPGRTWLTYTVRVDGVTGDRVTGFYADTPPDVQRRVLREQAERCARMMVIVAALTCDTTRDLRRYPDRPRLLPCT